MKRLSILAMCIVLLTGLLPAGGYAAGKKETLPPVREGVVVREYAQIEAKDGVEPFAELWNNGRISADLSDAAGLVWTLQISDSTVFLNPGQMPKGYDPQALLEWGKTPGLNIDILHAHGFTGKGAVIAYVDQPFAPHEQYRDARIHYTNNTDAKTSMHGVTVVSMLMGKDTGTAPEAELYYYGHASWEGDMATRAECLYQIIEQNRTLPEGQKIRMVGFSDNIRPDVKNNDEFVKAVNACEEAGIMVWFCGDYSIAAFVPMSDRNNMNSLTFSNWMDRYSPELVYVPAEGTTAAAESGEEGYTYWSKGGLSWTMPYILGLYAIVLQIDPTMTKDEIRQMVTETAYENAEGMRIVDPLAFVCAALRRVGRDAEAEKMEAEARARRRYLYAVMDTAQMTEEDLEAVGAWLGCMTDCTPVIVDAASFPDASGLYTAMRQDAAERGGITAGVQIFGTPKQVPAFEVRYKADMGEYGVHDTGTFLTDLFYGNFENDPDMLTADWSVMDDVADGTLDVKLTPAWPVVRLPLEPGKYKAFFEKYRAFVLDTGLTRLDMVNFSNPIFASSLHLDDFGTFLKRADGEFEIVNVPYRLYGNLKGQYPVANEVLGGFEKENLTKENETGPVEFIINTHGQWDNIDNAIFEDGEEKRISLVNRENIGEILKANPYYLDGWCCSNGYGMADNLVTAALDGQCMGMFAATDVISNNGVNNRVSPEEMKNSNFYYFYYHYLKALNEGKTRSQAFFTAQREYGQAVEPCAAVTIDMGEGNPHFNLYNLLVYHNFGVMEPNPAAMATFDSKCLITQSAESVPKKVMQLQRNGGNARGSSMQLTDGSPSGKEQKIKHSISNKLKEGKVTVHRATKQKLDNGYTRYTVAFTAREGLRITVFSPPDGDKFMMFGGPTTGEEEELVFDLGPDDLKGVKQITMSFFVSDDDRSFVFLTP